MPTSGVIDAERLRAAVETVARREYTGMDKGGGIAYATDGANTGPLALASIAAEYNRLAAAQPIPGSALSSPETTPAPDAGLDVERLTTALYRAGIRDASVATLARNVAVEYGPASPETTPAETDASAEPWAEAAMWAYQFAGALSTAYDFEEGDIVPLLDMLSALAEGRIPPVEWPAVVPSIARGDKGPFASETTPAGVLRDALWQCGVESGMDTDGDEGPDALIAGMGEAGFAAAMVEEVRRLRLAYDECLSEPAGVLDEAALEQALRNVTNANHWNVHNTDGDYVGRPRVAAELAREYDRLAAALGRSGSG